MTFVRISNHCEKSDCSRFTVCAYSIAGVWRFGAWRAPAELLGIYAHASSARRRCEQEAGKYAQPAP